MRKKNVAALLLTVTSGIAICSNALAQETDAIAAPASRLSQTIDSNKMVTLPGHVRRDLTLDRDLGAVEDSMPIRLMMVLKRTPEQQAALDALVARQQQPGTPEYHQWLTPQQYGARFGLAPADTTKISHWLESQGFEIKGVLNNAAMIEFIATAGGIKSAFHTEMHYWNVRQGKYVANAQDPMIPAALANVVAGIKGLSKVPAEAHHTPIRSTTFDAATRRWRDSNSVATFAIRPQFASPDGNLNITPQDFYTIYNVNKVYATGNRGGGAIISIPEPTDMHYGTVDPKTGKASGGDVATFRRLFGVAGTLDMRVIHGAGSTTCDAPGITDAEGEATLDAEWANAVAPSAQLIFMSCGSTAIGDGYASALTALIDNNISDVISSSYGSSEITRTAADFAMDEALTSQAAAQGQTFIDAAGDAGAADADQNTTGTATNGLNVDNFAGPPLVTAVGGTDFSDKYDADQGGLPQSTYWGAANSQFFANAKGYVPETPWNSSCADSIIAKDNGNYTGAGYCGLGPDNNLTVNGSVVGGGGGFSSHYALPAYQAGTPGLPSGATKRAVPDIAFFAANGFWGHSLIVCDSSDPSSACTSDSTFGSAGGTSFTAPQFAGVTALLINSTGERQGFLNPALYALGKAQYAAKATATACYSNGQTANTGVTVGLPASSCIFNDITTGNNDEPCEKGSKDCYVNPGAEFGMLSQTGSNSLVVAYPAGPGYDLASGLGSVNVFNLVSNWTQAFSSNTTLKANPTTLAAAQSTVLTATVATGTPTGHSGAVPALSGKVSFSAGGAALASCTLTGNTCSSMVSGSVLQPGANAVTATFSGSRVYPSSTSGVVTVTVSAPAGNSVSLVASNTLAEKAGGGYQATVTVKNTGGATAQNVVLTRVVLGTAAGTIAGGSVGTLAAGASAVIVVTVPAAAGKPGSTVAETFAGTYKGGSFGGAYRIALP